MGSSLHFSFDSLPARYRVQVEQQLAPGFGSAVKREVGGTDVSENAAPSCSATETLSAVSAQEPHSAHSGASGGSCEHTPIPVNVARRKRVCGRIRARKFAGGMNKTEKEFFDSFLNGEGQFEAISFKVAEKCRYTPDFCVWDDVGELTCYEVKGEYPLPSENRARLAFLTCREKYPAVTFRWFKRKGKGRFEEKYVNENEKQETDADSGAENDTEERY